MYLARSTGSLLESLYIYKVSLGSTGKAVAAGGTTVTEPGILFCQHTTSSAGAFVLDSWSMLHFAGDISSCFATVAGAHSAGSQVCRLRPEIYRLPSDKPAARHGKFLLFMINTIKIRWIFQPVSGKPLLNTVHSQLPKYVKL